MRKRKQEEYVPDEVERRKQLMVSQVRRLKLEVWPEDTRRLLATGKKRHGDSEKDKDVAAVNEIGEWYLLCNGQFIVRLHHSWISDKAWAYFSKEWRSDAKDYGLSNLQRKLQEAGPWWTSAISPHGGGALQPVKVKAAGEKMLNVRDTLVACSFEQQPYFFPAGQLTLVRQFYPDCKAHLARDLTGYDLWGNEVTRSCPLTLTDEEEGGSRIVAFIMPLHWR